MKLINYFSRSFLSLILISTFVFAGCTSSQRDARSPKTILTLAGWQSTPQEKQALQKLIQDFETENPEIDVQYETINSQYMDVIQTRLAGDNAPDIFYLDALEAPALIKQGVLEPLDSYIPKNFALEDFEPSLIKAFKYQDKIYGIPKDFSTLALFYNRKLLASAGITQPPKTWTELLEFSKKLTLTSSNKTTRYGLGISPELARQYFTIKAFGGELINQEGEAVFAESNAIKGLQLIVDQYQKDKSSIQPADVGANSGSDLFGQGKAAMAIEGPWAIPYLKENFPNLEFATAEVPTINNKKGTMAYTVAYVMNKAAKNKEVSWKLIDYLTNKSGMKKWASSGLVLPSRKSTLAEINYDKDPLYSPFVRGASYATIWQAGDNLPIIMNNFNNQFLSAILGQQSLSDAMQKAQDTANKEIKAIQ
ncbi:ABC transporter substrate-binding protein [Merismopedia glauca]|uniref:ABC transporter substrate-binding protein n=1 Tax=Merismopedia glauca CCAP 1448/3 TaxID=1296344 RepID=A0A2T1CAI2_9CYAN|nr:ABC transporter substrate-binding protein [Merismopedia glauca]PSB05254.1 ABC transporter substrate-binding protein [Merismopedia glauca CCAP 1448/3]